LEIFIVIVDIPDVVDKGMDPEDTVIFETGIEFAYKLEGSTGGFKEVIPLTGLIGDKLLSLLTFTH
jgi:hypothetical protein